MTPTNIQGKDPEIQNLQLTESNTRLSTRDRAFRRATSWIRRLAEVAVLQYLIFFKPTNNVKLLAPQLHFPLPYSMRDSRSRDNMA